MKCPFSKCHVMRSRWIKKGSLLSKCLLSKCHIMFLPEVCFWVWGKLRWKVRCLYLNVFFQRSCSYLRLVSELEVDWEVKWDVFYLNVSFTNVMLDHLLTWGLFMSLRYIYREVKWDDFYLNVSFPSGMFHDKTPWSRGKGKDSRPRVHGFESRPHCRDHLSCTINLDQKHES